MLLKYLIKITPNAAFFILSCMIFCLRKYHHLATVPQFVQRTENVQWI